MTTPYYSDDVVTLHHGDCLDVLRTIPDASVDAVVTDPPYALEFMGRGWDKFTPLEFELWVSQWAAECLRVLKPGGHMLAFGGSRTWHRLAAGIEDAGFEIRDSIAWLYGSGFPKSLDVSKAIDAAAGATREVIGPRRDSDGRTRATEQHAAWNADTPFRSSPMSGNVDTAPATDAARTWEGWGTALKPAFEPVVVARKPLTGTVAANVLAYGTGALNIDGARVSGEDAPAGRTRNGGGVGVFSAERRGYDDGSTAGSGIGGPEQPAGRWPANVVLDESQAAELDRQSGVSRSPKPYANSDTSDKSMFGLGGVSHSTNEYGDSGGASRFFPTFRYEAKAPTSERPSYTKDGAGTGRVTGLGGKVRQCNVCETRAIESGASEPSCGHGDFRWEEPTTDTTSKVAHPTVKPLDLMRWLVRLVTPPGGVVLEPFAGSGTTVEAAVLEGFSCIAIEREAEYLPLIEQRLSKPLQQSLFDESEVA